MPSLVTVAMPVHNGAPFLQAALNSAYAQTYADLEVLVYDDASQDATPDILAHQIDPRLRVVTGKVNRGVAWARNCLREQAQGDFLVWLDSDDIFYPERVAQLLRIAQTTQADLVIDRCGLIDEQGQRLPGGKAVPDQVAQDPCFTRIFERNTMLPHPLVSRRCFRALGYDNALQTSEDYDLWLRCSRAGFRFARCDAQLMDYRIRAGSLSAEPHASLRALRRILDKHALSDLMALYRERGYSERVIAYMACLQCLFREDYAQALHFALQPWEAQPGVDPLFYRGTLALLCGDLEQAVVHLKGHLEHCQDSPAGWNNLGVAQQRRHQDPQSCWEKALALFSQYSDARANLAGAQRITLTQLAVGRPR